MISQSQLNLIFYHLYDANFIMCLNNDMEHIIFKDCQGKLEMSVSNRKEFHEGSLIFITLQNVTINFFNFNN